jgi:hypothetical protein
MAQATTPTTRRRVLRILAGASLATASALAPRAASAGRGWCKVDPIIRLGAENIGPEIHVWAAVRWDSMREARRLSRGPIEVELFLPVGVPAVRLDKNGGFGDGFRVRFRRDPRLRATGTIQLRVRVLVPFDRNTASMSYVTMRTRPNSRPRKVAGTRGRTNRWMTYTLAVPALTAAAVDDGAPATP